MSFQYRPVKRGNTPLIIGVAGPTKSGKTYSAHRLAKGIANGGAVAMLNAEGAKGHQYADEFDYLGCDIDAPFSPERYTEALKAALAIEPAVVIVDSVSHMHNGPGGMLEYHEAEKQRMGGSERVNFTAWIKPKAAETEFIYTLLGANCHVILCFRAKEKIKIIKGAEPKELGWQPIASEAIPFETIFTVMLPPGSKGVPDLAISDMRKPFDKMIKSGRPLDESLGAELAAWAAGGKSPVRERGLAADQQPEPATQADTTDATDDVEQTIADLTAQLLAVATDENRDAVESAIARNKISHWHEPAKHIAWLEGQLDRVGAPA